jgi:sulfur relay (sulfurtransferase) complex TusBCD TusD component (DsrE family)
MTASLALVVSTAPERGDFERAVMLALAARERSIDVSMFFMHDAVRGLPQRRAQLERLTDAGCDLIVCAHSAHELGLSELDVGALLGSQDDHAAIVHAADRVVSFT